MHKINPGVVDLFCGAGGFSKGFEMAGCKILLGVDFWEDALKTFDYNHKSGSVFYKDIRKISGREIESIVDDEIDIVIGGPPCQGFSLSGKRKSGDSRNDLIYEFFRLVKEISPEVFVMENVEGLKSLNKGKYLLNLVRLFNDAGYSVDYKVLNSADYGVPQIRKRIFLIGNNCGRHNKFPAGRYIKKKQNSLFENDETLKEYVTVREAIDDLPSLEKDLNLKGKPLDYITPPKNNFQKRMRKNSDKVFNHQGTDHWDKTKKMISLVPEGGNWRNIPKDKRKEQKFSARYTRLDGDEPSITIDTGHRHHFHYKENRVPTVREKARIQSFPDDFIFKGSKTSQNKQVGNAVPCMLAQAIAEIILKYM